MQRKDEINEEAEVEAEETEGQGDEVEYEEEEEASTGKEKILECAWEEEPSERLSSG